MSKSIITYRMSKNYTKMEIFEASSMTKAVLAVTTVRPRKGADRRTRYNILAENLYGSWKIPAPTYRTSTTA